MPHNLNTTYPDITVPLCIVMPGLEVIEMTGGAGWILSWKASSQLRVNLTCPSPKSLCIWKWLLLLLKCTAMVKNKCFIWLINLVFCGVFLLLVSQTLKWFECKFIKVFLHFSPITEYSRWFLSHKLTKKKEIHFILHSQNQSMYLQKISI